MNAIQKSEIIRILEIHKGDDLNRAKMAFKGQDLDQVYGESGLTKRQIVKGYETHAYHIDRLIRAISESNS